MLVPAEVTCQSDPEINFTVHTFQICRTNMVIGDEGPSTAGDCHYFALEVLNVMFESTLQTTAHDKAVCRQVLSSLDVIALYSFASPEYSPVDVA
jgi:hypothetical protein